ncbi:MAG: phage tail tube protein [Alphaproteobacteria bacterium]
MPGEFISVEDVAVLAKIETTYGTDAVPGAATDGLLTNGFTIRPLEAGQADRALDRPGFGADPALLVGSHVQTSFNIEVAGAGAAGDVPAYGQLLRMCGFAETNTPATDTVYDPVSSGFESGTLHAFLKDQKYALTGFRAACGVTLSAQDVPRFNFNGLGLFNAPADGAAPSPDFSAYADPVPVEDAHTEFQLGGVDLPMVSLTIQPGQNVIYENIVNQECVAINGRSYSGSLSVKMDELLATFDPVALARAGTLQSLNLIHGKVAGNIVEISAPAVQLGAPTTGNRNGDRTWEIPLTFTVTDAVDDDIQFAIR